MRKAAFVLATSVAFLLSGVGVSHAATKKTVSIPSAQSVVTGSGLPVKSGSSLSIPGDLIGEFIPGDNPSRTTPIKVLPTLDFSIPRTIVAAKNILSNNAASIVVGGVISGMIVGLDWVMGEGSQVQKKNKTVDGVSVSSEASSDPQFICSQITYDVAISGVHIRQFNGVTYAVKVARTGGAAIPGYGERVNNCTNKSLGYTAVGGSYPVSGARQISTADIVNVNTPLTADDLSLVDAYVNARESDWVRDLLIESCQGSNSPASCFNSLKDNSFLSGPSNVSGPSTFSTSTGSAGTTTKETKTTYAITYGDNFFIYSPTTTTTTVNPDGTSDVETETDPETEDDPQEDPSTDLGDPYAAVTSKYNDIASDLGSTDGSMSFINYGPWYTFGGTCFPLTLNLPVMGVYVIDHCPYVMDWIRPTLGFLFAVWTWLHCFALWRETIQNARPI